MASAWKKRRDLVWGTSTGLLALLCVAILGRLGAFTGLDAAAQARLLRAQRHPFSKDVVLVAVDDRSFADLQYPFPRAMIARVLEAISAAGPKAVGMDMLLTPRAVDGPEGNALLARALSANPKTVLALSCTNSQLRPEAELSRALFNSTVIPGETPALACPSAIVPYPPLMGTSQLGHVQLAVAQSDANRGLFMFVDVGRLRVPALAAQMYLNGEDLDRAGLVQLTDGVRIGDERVPTTPSGEFLVSPRRLSTLTQLSFADLVHAIGQSEPARLPDAMARALHGRYVLVGNTAIQINDLGHGVAGELIPLVLMHASMLSDLIEGHFIASANGGLQWAVFLVLGLFAIALALYTRPAVATLSIAILVLGLLGGGLLLLRNGILIAPLAPFCGAVLAFSAALTSRMIVRENERGILRSAFGSYVDADHLERILESPEQYLSLGGARKQLTILFSDIQGYTALSNVLPPEEIIGLMRDYLSAMTHRVRERGGRVDKIMGDGIMAVFGDPIPNDQHALAAVEVALDMQRTIQRLREQWGQNGRAQISIRIGIATGEAFVGNIGSPGAKMEYTALGPTVNLASRLEGRAPAGGILVSGPTRDAVADQFELELIRGLQLKGFSEEYEAFLVRGLRRVASSRAG